MADRITHILESASQRPLFALGLAHWIDGDYNLQRLLHEKGYRFQRIDGVYDADLFRDLSDATSRMQQEENDDDTIISGGGRRIRM